MGSSPLGTRRRLRPRLPLAPHRSCRRRLEAELRDVASRWYEDPFDPARPLWQFVIVDGVEGHGARCSRSSTTASVTASGCCGCPSATSTSSATPAAAGPEPGIAEVGAGEGAGTATNGDDRQAGHRSTGPSPLLGRVTGALWIARLAGWPLGMAGRAWPKPPRSPSNRNGRPRQPARSSAHSAAQPAGRIARRTAGRPAGVPGRPVGGWKRSGFPLPTSRRPRRR